MDKFKKKGIFYIILMVNFLIFPLIIVDTGSAMFLLLIVIPLVCLISSIFFGLINGFDIWYILFTVIMVILMVLIHLNSSGSIYIVIYSILAFSGDLTGVLLKNWERIYKS